MHQGPGGQPEWAIFGVPCWGKAGCTETGMLPRVPAYHIAALKPGHLRHEKNSLAKARNWKDKEHPVICKVPTVGLRGPFLKGSLPVLHSNEASERPSVRIGQRMGRTRDLGHVLCASAAFIRLPSRPSLGLPGVREPFTWQREHKEETDGQLRVQLSCQPWSLIPCQR